MRSRRGDSAAEDHRHSKSRCECLRAVSFPKRFPVIKTAGRTDNVSHDFNASSHASQPAFGAGLRSGRHHLSNGLAKAGYANRLAGLADLFQHAQALSFELGNGHFLHGYILTMVNDYGQYGNM